MKLGLEYIKVDSDEAVVSHLTSLVVRQTMFVVLKDAQCHISQRDQAMALLRVNHGLAATGHISRRRI